MSNKVLNRNYVFRQISNYHNTYIDRILKDTSDIVNTKVDKVSGYGLSKNDFTDELKNKLDGLSNYDDTAVRALIQANTNSLTVLKGNGNGSVTKTVEDTIDAIIDNSPEAFDTLKEISDWIDEHEKQNSNMPLAIQQNANDITTLKTNMDSLEYELEDENIDFASDTDFVRYEWIKVVENSISFIGSGSLTTDPNDYTIDLISCIESFDGTVSYSDPLTTVLSNVTALSYDVNIDVDKNLNTANITVIGICANSSSYTSGKVDVVHFSLNEWSRVDDTSLEFSSLNNAVDEYTLTNNLNDYVIDAMLSREVDANNVVTTTPEAVNLNTVRATGADVSVNLTESRNTRTSVISISGYDLTSEEYTGQNETLNYTMRDWFIVDDSNISYDIISNNKSDYYVDLIHCMQTADGSYVYSDPVKISLADAETLGLTVDITFSSGANGRKAVVSIQGIDISSNSYTGNVQTITHTFEDWYSISGDISRVNSDIDLTNSTSDYQISVNHNVGKDSAISTTTSTMTLAQAMSVGLGATINLSSTMSNGSIERVASIAITGSSLNSTSGFTTSSSTSNFTLTDHEWFDTDYAVSLEFTGNSGLSDTKSDYTLSLAYVKENDSGVYSTQTINKTLTQLDAAGLTTSVTKSTPSDKPGVTQATITVSGAGISDNSKEYSSTVSTRTFNLYEWNYVDDEIRYTNTGNGLNSTLSDYEVDVYKYATKSSNSSTGTLISSTSMTLNDLANNLGLTVSLTDSATDCAKQMNISISGYSITSNTSYDDTSNTITGSLHEWLTIDTTATFDTQNVTSSGNYDNCTVNKVGRRVETDTNGTVSVIETNQIYTIANLKANGITCNTSHVTNNDGTNYTVTHTLVASGKNLKSATCINATQSVTLSTEKDLVYTATASSAGNGIKYDSISNWEDQ